MLKHPEDGQAKPHDASAELEEKIDVLGGERHAHVELGLGHGGDGRSTDEALG